MKWILFLSLLSSCSLFLTGKGPESAKGSQYKINFDSSDWTNKTEERSDYVWENKKDGRILLSNSFCKEFQDEPLKDLAQKTFKTVSEHKIDAEEYTTFNHREAYRMKGKGNVDGVPVEMELLNTRRNNCYYDFVSITPLDSAKPSEKDFEKFLKAVDFK